MYGFGFALGMSPQVAFPIMMGSCAFLMPPASVRFIREGAYNRKAAVAMSIPGVDCSLYREVIAVGYSQVACDRRYTLYFNSDAEGGLF
jgi:hypothetical protein